MVRKKNEKWRMCIDFTDLNKCCPKDPYPLPRIDKLVHITAGCEVMSLLDCFSGYHQIWLNPDVEDKMSFITLGGTYCYRRMPKGLWNVALPFLGWHMVFLTNRKSKILSHMSTTSWSRAIRRPIFMTFRKHSKTFERPSSGWTQINAYLASRKANCLVV